MESIIALAQCGSTQNIEENLRIAAQYMKSAKQAHASMIRIRLFYKLPDILSLRSPYCTSQ